MTEEQYKKTFNYKHNELCVAYANFLVALSSNWNWAYRHAIQYRVTTIEKAEQDYYDFVDDDLPTRLEGSD